ncbi:MAG: deoxynucleoside kinase [Candidatus Eremiobacteraeota bacterium]|nr:deoxynucleoside kinase [Candidatus Eremiobacteraeota bacterium]
MFIAISGPIGVGKSTVTRIFSQIAGFEPHFETVEGHPYLEGLYREPRQYAFRTQAYFMWDRFEKHMASVKKGVNIIADRSIYEDAIFAGVLHSLGHMDDDEYLVTYLPHFKLLTSILPAPDLMIYLQADIDTLMFRISKRAREMEKGIQRSYMELLLEGYERWIAEYPHKKLIVETDDLDLTCDLNPDWLYLVKAISKKVVNDDIPEDAISLTRIKSQYPVIQNSNDRVMVERELFKTAVTT